MACSMPSKTISLSIFLSRWIASTSRRSSGPFIAVPSLPVYPRCGRLVGDQDTAKEKAELRGQEHPVVFFVSDRAEIQFNRLLFCWDPEGNKKMRVGNPHWLPRRTTLAPHGRPTTPTPREAWRAPAQQGPWKRVRVTCGRSRRKPQSMFRQEPAGHRLPSMK